jgi:site-specific DNA recombinase
MAKAKQKVIQQTPVAMRCAIYTRKSTDEGLEKEFNSLHAQREAGEAYIASQASEGWVCLPDRYDDGGFSGGNMDRPALSRLLKDIEAGKVDCVVVYKLDRLSRSLMDFQKLLEIFEPRNVAFVSVTQQINTTSSSGRLMMNVLMSFAQFEREIISERTRDKIAAARRKGKWSGGLPLLGYDVDPRGSKLVVNSDEAERVRAIFELYLENRSLMQTIRVLDERGWVNKRWIKRDGLERGGKCFSKSTLFNLLTNVTYRGMVKYKTEVHLGEHERIVSEELWQQVNALLGKNGSDGGASVRNRFGAILKGLIRCVPCNCAMTPYHVTKSGSKRYRYYVCCNAQKRGWHNCPSKTIPAGEIEKHIVEQIRCIGRDPELVRETVENANRQTREEIESLTSERNRPRKQ